MRPFDNAIDADQPTLLVLGCIGSLWVAWLAAAIERVLPMVALTRLPNAAPEIAGLLSLHGETLVVVDPRPLLGLATVRPLLDQHLLVLNAATRYALWVDRADRTIEARPSALQPLPADLPSKYAQSVVRVEGRLFPVLTVAAFEPSRVTGQ